MAIASDEVVHGECTKMHTLRFLGDGMITKPTRRCGGPKPRGRSDRRALRQEASWRRRFRTSGRETSHAIWPGEPLVVLKLTDLPEGSRRSTAIAARVADGDQF